MLYDKELLGRTYVWIDLSNPTNILAMVTLANDSVKAKFIANSARNRLQRRIVNAKRGINYPAVLIGRHAVAAEYRGNYEVKFQLKVERYNENPKYFDYSRKLSGKTHAEYPDGCALS